MDYSRAEPGDGGAGFVVLILGALVTLGALLLQIAFHPPMWLHLVIWFPVTLVGAVLLLRPIKAALVYQQYWTNNFSDDFPATADEKPSAPTNDLPPN